MKYLLIVSSVLALGVVTVAAPARADECNELMYLKFSAPVELPRVTLPAGTYRFIHPDCSTRILSVTSQDGSQVYGTFLTIPEERHRSSSKLEVVVAEMPTGQPEAIKAWFYPGETTGDELIYPKNEAPKVADAPAQKLFATNG